jgi:hypothetical protein
MICLIGIGGETNMKKKYRYLSLGFFTLMLLFFFYKSISPLTSTGYVTNKRFKLIKSEIKEYLNRNGVPESLSHIESLSDILRKEKQNIKFKKGISVIYANIGKPTWFIIVRKKNFFGYSQVLIDSGNEWKKTDDNADNNNSVSAEHYYWFPDEN